MAPPIPDQIKEWTRELLGGRGFIKAWNDPRDRRKIMQIAERVDELRLDAEDVRDYFLQSKDASNGLDAVIDKIGKPQGKAVSPYSPPAQSASAATGSSVSRSRKDLATSESSRAATAAASTRPTMSQSGEIGRDESAREEIARVRADLESTRRHARDLEELARALTERAVLDATRIKGLEAALMTIASAAGMSETIEQAYFTGTAQYLDPRMAQLARATSAPNTTVRRAAGVLPLP
jgi:hypothetical protein